MIVTSCACNNKAVRTTSAEQVQSSVLSTITTATYLAQADIRAISSTTNYNLTTKWRPNYKFVPFNLQWKTARPHTSCVTGHPYQSLTPISFQLTNTFRSGRSAKNQGNLISRTINVTDIILLAENMLHSWYNRKDRLRKTDGEKKEANWENYMRYIYFSVNCGKKSQLDISGGTPRPR